MSNQPSTIPARDVRIGDVIRTDTSVTGRFYTVRTIEHVRWSSTRMCFNFNGISTVMDTDYASVEVVR